MVYLVCVVVCGVISVTLIRWDEMGWGLASPPTIIHHPLSVFFSSVSIIWQRITSTHAVHMWRGTVVGCCVCMCVCVDVCVCVCVDVWVCVCVDVWMCAGGIVLGGSVDVWCCVVLYGCVILAAEWCGLWCGGAAKVLGCASGTCC